LVALRRIVHAAGYGQGRAKFARGKARLNIGSRILSQRQRWTEQQSYG
jgi:hypothetical protein